jgi:hypothetical protein
VEELDAVFGVGLAVEFARDPTVEEVPGRRSQDGKVLLVVRAIVRVFLIFIVV